MCVLGGGVLGGWEVLATGDGGYLFLLLLLRLRLRFLCSFLCILLSVQTAEVLKRQGWCPCGSAGRGIARLNAWLRQLTPRCVNVCARDGWLARGAAGVKEREGTMSLRLACAAVLGCAARGAWAQHTCADQNNDGVADDGTGKQPDAFTVADCATGYTLRADLADATCATFACTSDECCLPPTDLPHPVDGGSITFTGVSQSTATLSWYAPDAGEYNADILGYNIQISKVCVLGGEATFIKTGTFGQQPGDARNLRTAAITGPSTGTATVEATGTGLTAYTPSDDVYSSFDDAAVIDTVKGTVLGDCGGSTSDWTDLTGVYSPVTGQDHDGQCVDACEVTPCAVDVTITAATAAEPAVLTIDAAAIASGSKVQVDGIVGDMGTDAGGLNGNTYYAKITAGAAGSAVTEIALYTDADLSEPVSTSGLTYTSGGTGSATIHHSCTGCYPRDPSVDAGCYAGAMGYPTEPLTSHTVTGLDSDSYYLFKIRSYNHFGTGEYGEPSYAVHTHGVPTEPLSLSTGWTTWQCANGFVVASSALNDGNNDCGDHSDEAPGVAASASLATQYTTAMGGGHFQLTWLAPANAGVGTDDCAPISFTITGATAADPAVLTVTSAAIPDGRKVRIDGIVGTMGTHSTNGLNGNTYYAKVTAGTDAAAVTEVTLYTDAELTAGVSTSGLTYTSGGRGAVQPYSASLAQLKEGSAAKCTTEGEGILSPVLSYSVFEDGSSKLTATSCSPPTGPGIAAATTGVGKLSCAAPAVGETSCADAACKFYAADDGPSPSVRCTMAAGDGSGEHEVQVTSASTAEECAANVLAEQPEANGATLATGTGSRDCYAEFSMIGRFAPGGNWESCIFEPTVRGRCEPYADGFDGGSESAPTDAECFATLTGNEPADWQTECEKLHCTYTTSTLSGRGSGGAVLTGSRSPKAIITGLAADTGYSFSVTATNAAGEGAPTDAFSLSTPQLPAKPNAAPVALQVTDTQVTLSYAHSMNVVTDGNAIEGYKLYAQSAIGPFTITDASTADPAVLTIDAAPIATGAEVTVASVVGTVGTDGTNGLNGNTYYAKVIAGMAGASATQIELYTDAALSAGADTSGLAYTSGGTITSWQAASRLLTNDGEDPGWAADPVDVNYVNKASSSVALGTTNDRSDALWLEITQLANDDFDYSDAVVSDQNTVEVPYLLPSTAYRFKIAFTNEVGTGTESDPSATFYTLDSEISNVRMYTGPPCVYQEPTATTFAASAAGTGVKYRWELVYKSGAGLAALNEDGSNPDANDFDANMDGDDDAIHSGRTTHVESGSTIALPGSSNCLNADCSVMNYQLPLPGFDEAVANYDEMEIRVVAYNTRGQVRESTVFGWTATDTHNYQTIEYCGCTDPLDDNYWDLATYMLPDSCAGVEDWQDSGVTQLSTVNAGEFEYYQFAVEERTFDVQVSLRVDDGAVDMFVSTAGVANPDLDSTHIVELQQLAVTGFAVVNLDYEHLKGERSVYVTIRGATGVSDPHCVGSSGCDGAEHVFGRYTLLAQSSNFRSYACSASDTDAQDSKGEIDCSSPSTATTAISRQVLQNEVPLTSVLPSRHYDFYEYYYPHAPADLDVEISVDVDEIATPSGAIQVYASKTERYPGPQRSLGEGAYPGYWTGVSHTCIARAEDDDGQSDATDDGTDGKQLYFTMAPTDHLDPTPNVLYLSVFGATPHAQGTELPSTKYEISAKVYRYRVESDLLQALVEDGPLTEDRRYSVVTEDNFNYYEVPLTRTTTKVLVEITVHYGTIDVYRSKTKLPTQDLSNPGNDLIDRSNIGSFYINSEDLNIPGGYVYLGLIGRTPDSSYDIKVTLVELDATEPTELFYCPGLSTNVGTSAACDTKLSTFDTTGSATYGGTGYAFFKLYIGTKDVDKYVTGRSGAGSAPTDLTTSADTWGTDWTEESVSTWSDSFSDEWDTDVSLEVTSALDSGGTDFNIVGSVLETYPAIERAYCSDGSTAEPCSHNSGGDPCTDTDVAVADRAAAKDACEASGEIWSVQSADNDDADDDTLKMGVDTFGGKWVYIAFTTTGDETVGGDVTVSFSNVGAQAVGDVSTDESYTAPTCSSLGDCNNNGVCVVDGNNAFCVCNTGYYGEDCSIASGLDQPTTGDPTVDISGANSIGDCTDNEVQEVGDEFCLVPEVVSGATEAITLDCATGIDNCKPRGTATKVGYVDCADDGVTCTQLMPAPMAKITITLTNVPLYGRLHTYIDGLPYPRAGANTFTIAEGGDVTKVLKVYALTPRAKHSVMLVLTTDAGESIATVQRHFGVKYMAGSGCEKVNDVECSGQGVCHQGYCICYDGYFGTDCGSDLSDESGVIGSQEIGSFEASKAYRDRVEAIALDKIGKAKFVSTMHLEETTVELARSKASLDSIKTTVNTKLQDTIYAEDDPTTGSDEGSTLHKTIIANKATTDAAVEKLRAKQARDTIRIQQAKQESARLSTANREAYLDHKRALYAHQTSMQNEFAASKVEMSAEIAAKNAAIDAAFTEGRFIKNQLRTANGPTTKISDLKTQECTTDQFFHTTCTDVDYDDTQFGETQYSSIPR